MKALAPELEREVALFRPRDFVPLSLAVVTAPASLAVGGALWATFEQRVYLLGIGTPSYRAATWASATALMACVALIAFGGIWLLAATARGLLRLPSRQSGEASAAWLLMRMVLAVPVVLWLLLASYDAVPLQQYDRAPLVALGVGLGLCGLFATTAILAGRDGLLAWRARGQLRRVALQPLDALPPGRRIRTRGLVNGPVDLQLGPQHASTLCQVHEHGGRPIVRCHVPWLTLRARGAETQVELDPARVVIQSEPGARSAATTVCAGDAIEVVADAAASGGDAYRGDRPLTGSEAPVYLLRDYGGMVRRLTWMAVTELATAAAFAIVTFTFVAMWATLGAFSH
jgi:hypothetical protein